MTEDLREIKCPHCFHIWGTGATGLKVTCPNCQLKIWIKENLVEAS